MDQLEVMRAKELRGIIIEKLYSFRGEDIPINTLKNLLRYKTYVTERNIMKEIDYLSGDKKEYLAIRKNEDDYFSSIIHITPMGINLAEGDLEDAGVIINV